MRRAMVALAAFACVAAGTDEAAGPRTAADMRIGESGWMVPWAACARYDDSMWMRTEFHVGYEREGARSMRVTRTEDGFQAWFTGSLFTWDACDCPGTVPVTFHPYVHHKTPQEEEDARRRREAPPPAPPRDDPQIDAPQTVSTDIPVAKAEECRLKRAAAPVPMNTWIGTDDHTVRCRWTKDGSRLIYHRMTSPDDVGLDYAD